MHLPGSRRRRDARHDDCGRTLTGGVSVPAGERANGTGATQPIRVVLVTSAGCHFCREVDRLLDKLQRTFLLSIERIDLTSVEGTAIARRWRVPFPPVLLIEGEYHGHGRISERKLTRALTRLIDQEE